MYKIFWFYKFLPKKCVIFLSLLSILHNFKQKSQSFTLKKSHMATLSVTIQDFSFFSFYSTFFVATISTPVSATFSRITSPNMNRSRNFNSFERLHTFKDLALRDIFFRLHRYHVDASAGHPHGRSYDSRRIRHFFSCVYITALCRYFRLHPLLLSHSLQL